MNESERLQYIPCSNRGRRCSNSDTSNPRSLFARSGGICGSRFRIGTLRNCSSSEVSLQTTPRFGAGCSYAPELNKRCRRELKPTNGSWRVDETYISQGGSWRYLYRAVDSTGAMIDFWFSAERDAAAAKKFFQKALQAPVIPDRGSSQ